MSFVLTKSEKETIKFAEKFLKKSMESAERGTPLIFYMEGDLGAGKTNFVKGLAKALDIKKRITSPTFVLIKKFVIPKSNAARDKEKVLFFHIDCYRLLGSKDAIRAGIGDILKTPKAIAAIEWAERIEDIIPKPYWRLKFEHAGENNRKIKTEYAAR